MLKIIVLTRQLLSSFCGNNNQEMLTHSVGVDNYQHIPQQAFLFVPHRSMNINQRDDYRTGKDKKIRRLLFEGWAQQTYTPFQLTKLSEFQSYLIKQKVVLGQQWTRPWKLRYLLSVQWDFQDCVQQIKKYNNYMKMARQVSFDRSVSRFLHQGFYYVAGRDCHYRPILVFNLQKMVSLDIGQQQIQKALTFLLHYVIKNMMIPGQVQNWVSIIDHHKEGIFSFLSIMNNTSKFLAENFRGRLFACYNVDVSTSAYFIWSVVRKILDDDTVQKINLTDQPVPEPLLNYCHPSQLEERHGGTLPNIKEGDFWPPRQRSPIYTMQKCPVQHISRQQYTQFYKNGTLFQTKFHEQNIIKPRSKDLRDNKQQKTLKNMEKGLKIQLEDCIEDQIDYEKDIRPFSYISSALDFNQRLAKDTILRTETTKK